MPFESNNLNDEVLDDWSDLSNAELIQAALNEFWDKNISEDIKTLLNRNKK